MSRMITIHPVDLFSSLLMAEQVAPIRVFTWLWAEFSRVVDLRSQSDSVISVFVSIFFLQPLFFVPILACTDNLKSTMTVRLEKLTSNGWEHDSNHSDLHSATNHAKDLIGQELSTYRLLRDDRVMLSLITAKGVMWVNADLEVKGKALVYA